MGLTKCPSCGHKNIPGQDRCTVCFHSLMNADLPKPSYKDNFQNVMMTAPIAELVTGKDLLIADPDDTMDRIISMLDKEKKNCVLVYKAHKMVGILSKRDILTKVAGNDKAPQEIKIHEIMTPNPEYVKLEDPIAFVINKMALGGFRHVPVLAKDGTPLGIIAIVDVLAYLSNVSSA